MTTTTQGAFHVMRGHMEDGCLIKMDNGDTLTLRALMNGWQLVKDSKPYGHVARTADEITKLVIDYGRAS